MCPLLFSSPLCFFYFFIMILPAGWQMRLYLGSIWQKKMILSKRYLSMKNSMQWFNSDKSRQQQAWCVSYTHHVFNSVNPPPPPQKNLYPTEFLSVLLHICYRNPNYVRVSIKDHQQGFWLTLDAPRAHYSAVHWRPPRDPMLVL